ncbi:MAG: GTPase [Peptococcaceae bacterium BICA1-7]|nr:MAG: GTPase [Peptococcaceae bacterium BICA1-7]HBV97649.1 methylmalonyl Co-A mutase-associated GTPase MeaB [Desulfotomaculum sp.]
MADHVDRLLEGDRRSAAKLITLIENELPEKEEIIRRIYPHTGKAHVIGVTGSPGAGKSSLIDRLVGTLRSEDLRVGVIAVDPSSPFSGGALLGDRIRMQEHALDRKVFIRSMGTRGTLGGLSRATKDVVKILDAYGSDVILIETVGVGQTELDIMHYADSTVVVLSPGAGDRIQAMKAGIMEIADLFVINKCDTADVTRIKNDIENMIDLSPLAKNWRPPVLKTSAFTGDGIGGLWDKLKEHKNYKNSCGSSATDSHKLKSELLEIMNGKVMARLNTGALSNGKMDEIIDSVLERRIDPYTAADTLLEKLICFREGA